MPIIGTINPDATQLDAIKWARRRYETQNSIAVSGTNEDFMVQTVMGVVNAWVSQRADMRASRTRQLFAKADSTTQTNVTTAVGLPSGYPDGTEAQPLT